MHIADPMHYRSTARRELSAGWWLLPTILLGAVIWASLVYALLT